MQTTKSFINLGLISPLLSSLVELGYEAPTPIQEQSIPILMEGGDLLAQAQTGTGKTAAFALPILSHLDISTSNPQALVVAPTRELAIQVAEAFQSYAKHLKGFRVAPIYGGQDYKLQLRALKRGAHVIVGTPGRLMDHLRRGTLSMETLKTVVLDEADEMLKMGFVEDIEWILSQIPHSHQTALFSATIPKPIQRIAERYLKDAQKIMIQPADNTVDAIAQFYITVAKNQKLNILTRFLETEEMQAAIIFARTKTCSAELAQKLQARGFAAAALNGDMKQSQRQKVIDQIKNGALDIIVATDVAARGIDVERITHVINFDIPSDTESYIHRIGRTGRAGRQGKALLFVTQREQRLLRDIEHAIRKKIKQIEPPSLDQINEQRNKKLFDKVAGVLKKSKRIKPYQAMIQEFVAQGSYVAEDIAAALAYLMQQPLSEPVALDDVSEPNRSSRRKSSKRKAPAKAIRNRAGRGRSRRRKS